LGSSGTVNHNASSPGSGITDSDNAPVTLAPSGVVLAALSFLFANAGGPPVPVMVSLTALNPDNSSAASFQPLRGGHAPVQITLSSSNPSVGSITPSVTISAGASNATAQFTPLSSGTTIVSVNPAPGFSTASNHTTLSANVSP
jgi:hypothetical protein